MTFLSAKGSPVFPFSNRIVIVCAASGAHKAVHTNGSAIASILRPVDWAALLALSGTVICISFFLVVALRRYRIEVFA